MLDLFGPSAETLRREISVAIRANLLPLLLLALAAGRP